MKEGTQTAEQDSVVFKQAEEIADLRAHLQVQAHNWSKQHTEDRQRITALEAENAHLRQELARLTESANKDRDILNTVVEAVSRRE